MYKRFLPFVFFGAFLIIISSPGCTKIDTTTLGSDLIPAVDNVNTFADTIGINTIQGIFNDSTIVGRTENHALGNINNDPLFGKTAAHIYVQLKPSFYPYYYGRANDTITGSPDVGLDSVVLALSYKGSWGDTTLPQELKVYAINDFVFRDSIFKEKNVNYSVNLGALLGSATVDIRTLGNKVKFSNGKDSATNMIRIKLTDPAFINALFSRDSSNNASTNAFLNDSLFRNFQNGLAIVASSNSSNALMYIGLDEENTRMEVHFRKRKANIRDTVFNTFRLETKLSNTLYPSASANHIIRDRAGYPVSNPGPDEVFVQTSPGTFVNLSMPRLTTFKDTNRIIHRAYISIEQVAGDPYLDSLLSPPPYLYVDLKDTSSSVTKWKPIYLDLNPGSLYNPDNRLNYFPAQVDHRYFGSAPKRIGKPNGQTVLGYEINVTRYIQQMVTRGSYNYDMRLFAPYQLIYPQYQPSIIPYDNPIAYGRIRVGSGTNPAYKMRLVIIWSKV